MSAAVATLRAETVILGAGIAGLATALRMRPMPVTVISPAPLGQWAASAWAQGGIAAALGPEDTAMQHAADTLAVAGGLADSAIVDLVTAAAPAAIAWLAALGTRFDRAGEGDGDGTWRLGREGGHGRHRIVHAAGDGTGAEVMRALIEAARGAPWISVIEGVEAEALLTADGAVCGVLARRGEGTLAIEASAVVLATGGAGALYRETSNPTGARGRGLALAARAGARLADLEFVQFHPTALDIGRDPMPLVTEALRGEGAVLLNQAGERFMAALDPLAELAPRDVVARAVWRERRAGGRVLLDARAAVGRHFPQAFPTVYAACRAAGLDPVTQPIPVAPAAHYHMGGIAVDATGRSSLKQLWVVGEAAATGLHGANRLASNSLLEALVFAARAAADIRGTMPARRRPRRRASLAAASPIDPAALAELRRLMSDCVGLERDADGLAGAAATMSRLSRRAATSCPALADAALVGALIAKAALERQESRGAHFRTDHPWPRSATPRRRSLTLDRSAA